LPLHPILNPKINLLEVSEILLAAMAPPAPGRFSVINLIPCFSNRSLNEGSICLHSWSVGPPAVIGAFPLSPYLRLQMKQNSTIHFSDIFG
jgi:hypothetical protein